ncbi:MAG: hypothetical protein Q8P44_05145, partial [Dehalococcoidia bacterium]|nr:hypothetical protein [Dehalococcoidia bacterium]
PVDSWGFVLLLPLVTLSNVVPVTVGGLGIREGLAALLLPAAGISAEVAATAFFTTFLLSIVLPGVVGLCWNTALLYTKRPTNNANTNAGPVLTEKDKQAN